MTVLNLTFCCWRLLWQYLSGKQWNIPITVLSSSLPGLLILSMDHPYPSWNKSLFTSKNSDTFLLPFFMFITEISFLLSQSAELLKSGSLCNPLLYFQFEDFNLENGYDIVSIYDGRSTSDPLVGNYSGSSLHNTSFLSSSNSLLVQFHSDQDNQTTGFKASWFEG